MANSKNYLAPLGLAVVGSLFGIGHFGELHETIFGSDNESVEAYELDYDNSYSTGYGGEISFRGKNCSGSVGCDCSGFSPITDGYVWQEEYCKHCGHKKSSHK